MALLNKDSYYYLQTYNDRNNHPGVPPKLLTHGGYPGTSVRKWDDDDYWYVEFVMGDAFHQYDLKTLMPNIIYKKIQQGRIKLCISNSHEAYHYVVDDIYKDIVIKHNIDPRNILYLSNSIDIGLEIEQVSKKYNLPKLRSECILLFELVAKDQINFQEENLFCTQPPNQNFYNKKFISLNGLYRPHRTLFVNLLSCLNLLDEGYVSLNACTNNSPELYPLETLEYLLQKSRRYPEVFNLLSENKDKLGNLERLYFDTTPNQPWNAADYISTDKKYYENTYFSAVTETLCFPDASYAGFTMGRAISEKTFKPICNMHPFLIIGVPRVLNFLKMLGYKTYESVIDESYDVIPNPIQRIHKIALEVQKLVNLTDSKLKDFKEACRPIALHNYETLKNKTVFNYPIT